MERSMNIKYLVAAMKYLYPLVSKTVCTQRQRMRAARRKGELANFSEGYYVLVAREHFHQDENFFLRWRGPRRVRKSLNDWVCKVEDLCNEVLETVHRTWLNFHADDLMHTDAIMSHDLSLETGIPVPRLLRLSEQGGHVFVLVHWKGLGESEDTAEPL